MKTLPDYFSIEEDTTNPIEVFLLKNEPAENEQSELFRKQLLDALNYKPQQILTKLISSAQQFKDAGFTTSFNIAKLFIADIQLLTGDLPKTVDGHVCGPFCEICKPHIEGEIQL